MKPLLNIPAPKKRPKIRKGNLVQLAAEWKYGPGVVIRFTDHGAAIVKWPQKGRKTVHNTRFLRKVTAQ